MDSPVTKLIFIAAAVAAAALVVAVMWSTLSNNAPETVDDVDYSKITTQALCEAARGTWTAGNSPPCA